MSHSVCYRNVAEVNEVVGEGIAVFKGIVKPRIGLAVRVASLGS